MPDFGRWTRKRGRPVAQRDQPHRPVPRCAGQSAAGVRDRSRRGRTGSAADRVARRGSRCRRSPRRCTPRDAVLALDRARRITPAHPDVWPSSGSAAAAVLCLGGFGAVVAGAGPGDALYGLRTMLFGEQQETRDDAVIARRADRWPRCSSSSTRASGTPRRTSCETLTTTVATVNDSARKEESGHPVAGADGQGRRPGSPRRTLPPDAPPPTFPERCRRSHRAWHRHTGSATTSSPREHYVLGDDLAVADDHLVDVAVDAQPLPSADQVRRRRRRQTATDLAAGTVAGAHRRRRRPEPVAATDRRPQSAAADADRQHQRRADYRATRVPTPTPQSPAVGGSATAAGSRRATAVAPTSASSRRAEAPATSRRRRSRRLRGRKPDDGN